MDGKRQKKATIRDKRIFSELKSKHLGTVLVDLPGLQYDIVDSIARLPKKKKVVKKLKRDFALEGCYRLIDEERHVAALISKDELREAVERSNISADALRSDAFPPKLIIPPSKPLKCLYGQHRLAAASNHFQDGDDWWVVDLISDDASVELQTHLREGYSNSTNFCDGEILCHILLYQECDDELNEMKWWARLSRDKRKDLKHILGIPGFSDAFASLTVIAGLWPPFHIGTFRRYCTLRCHEYLLNYLRRIYSVLSFIANNNREIMQLMDPATIGAIGLRAPQVSTEDAAFIHCGMEAGKLFCSVDPPTREQIWRNIMSVPYPYLIPTLSSFCEDTKYLEPIAKAMKLLVDLEPEETVEQAFRRVYLPNHDEGFLPQQDGEHKFVQVDSDEAYRFRHSIQQLLLKCMRSFPQAVNIACRKDADEAKPSITEPNAVVAHQLAFLAETVGFKSNKIQELMSNAPEAQEIYTCLTRLQPDEDVDETQLKSDVQEHLQLWHTQKSQRLRNPSTSEARPLLVVDTVDQEVSQRCGRPFNGAHKSDKKFLFLRWICETNKPHGRYITSFFVKMSIFVAFFWDDDVPLGSSRPPKDLQSEKSPTNPPTIEQPQQQGSDEPSTTAIVLSDYDFEMVGASTANSLILPHNTGVDIDMFDDKGGELTHQRKAVFRLEEGGNQIYEVYFLESAVQDAVRHFAHNKFRLVFKEGSNQQIVPPERCYSVLNDWGAKEMWCRLLGPFPTEDGGEGEGKKRKLDVARAHRQAAFEKAINEIEEL